MTVSELRVRDLSAFLEARAPLSLAEQWDNVGLLVGDELAPVRRVMTCLTLTSDVAREAVEREANLVVSHHPVLFKAVQRLTSATLEGAVLLTLAAKGISVYSPHTAFDSARDGINQQLAIQLGLTDVQPLRPPVAGALPTEDLRGIGGGRCGRLLKPLTLAEFNALVKSALKIPHLQYVGQSGAAVVKVGVACGSAAEFIPDALRLGCEVLLTGEARFHACLEARERGLGLVLAGHYATERPAVESLASLIHREFPALEVWGSETESDPLAWSVSS